MGKRNRVVGWTLIVCLGLLAAACTQLPSTTSGVNSDFEAKVTVTIDQELSLAFIKKNPQFQLKTLAQTVEKIDENFGIVENGSAEGNYLLDQFVVRVDGGNLSSLDRIAKNQGLNVLDRGSVPEPPRDLPAKQIRKVEDRGFRLVGFNSASAKTESVDVARLGQRLQKAGYKGEVKFSSIRAAQVFDKMLKVKEEQSEALSVEANWFGTTDAAYVEHRNFNVGSGYSTTDDNDPLYQNRVSGRNGTPAAWDLWAPNPIYPTNLNRLTGAGVYVAIIDTGFDTTNYDLTGYDPVTNTPNPFKYVYGYDFTGSDYNVNVSLNEDCVQGNAPANCYHGTRAAASAVGARNNHYGSAGSAPNGSPLLFRVRGTVGVFFWYSYIIDFYLASRAVDTAVAWGAKVISMSFSSPGGFGCGNQLVICNLRSSVQNAVFNYNVIPLAAAGNENCECPRAPGDWPEVISIGALAAGADVRASYSNWGSAVELFSGAEGYSVPVPADSCYALDRCVSTNYFNFYFNGTSSATPYAAGVVALIKQMLPNATFAQVKYALESTARTSGDPNVGRKIIDAYQALYYLGARP
jgi:subtilisin family serine protease